VIQTYVLLFFVTGFFGLNAKTSFYYVLWPEIKSGWDILIRYHSWIPLEFTLCVCFPTWKQNLVKSVWISRYFNLPRWRWFTQNKTSSAAICEFDNCQKERGVSDSIPFFVCYLVIITYILLVLSFLLHYFKKNCHGREPGYQSQHWSQNRHSRRTE